MSGVEELARELYAARARKPILAIANTLAASAAYWIGSQADELVVTPSAEVGSIGIVHIHEDHSEQAAKAGVRFTVIAKGERKAEGSPFEPLSEEARADIEKRAGAYYDQFVGAVARGRDTTEAGVRFTVIAKGERKAEGSPFEPLSEEARADIEKRAGAYYDQFVGAVARGRDTTEARVRADYGEGALVTSREAVRLGMADRVATYEQTLARLARAPQATAQPAVAPAARERAARLWEIALTKEAVHG